MSDTVTDLPIDQSSVADIERLRALVGATGNVLDLIDLLDACRYGPPPVIEAATTDLRQGLQQLDAVMQSTGGGLRAITTRLSAGPDHRLGTLMAATVRTNVRQIRERTAGLHLELRRMLADTRSVIAVATGSSGTYDATGQTAAAPLRRDRGSA